MTCRTIATTLSRLTTKKKSIITTKTCNYLVDPLAPPGSVPRNRQNPSISNSMQPDFDFIKNYDINDLYGKPKKSSKPTPSLSDQSTSHHPLQIPKPSQKFTATQLATEQRQELAHEAPSPETLKIVESIEDYNTWIGNKMSQPILQALQSLFITHGLAQPPTSISTITPKRHIIETLLNHGIIVPQGANLNSLVPDVNKRNKKQPYVIEFLKSMRHFGLFTPELLDRYKPGYINPNIPFTSGNYKTNNFNTQLQVESTSDAKVQTVIDTMIDCLRLSGAFDVQTINPQTLKQKLSGLLTPPNGESSRNKFDHVTLEKYNQTTHKHHESAQHSSAWYHNTLKNEVSIPTLQRLHAQFYRYDISYAFRIKFEDLYNKMMSFDQEALIQENPGMSVEELIDKYAPTKAELQLFRSLIQDEHTQTRFYQNYIKTAHPTEFISINNQSYANVYQEKKANETKQRQYIGGLFKKLQNIVKKDDYPEVYLSNDKAHLSDDDDMNGTGQGLKKSGPKFMVLPPEENIAFTSTKKLFYLLVSDGIIPMPPVDYKGTMQEWIIIDLVYKGVLKILPPDSPDAVLELPLLPHPDKPNEMIELETEEHELIDMLYELEIIPENMMGKVVPDSQTPLLLKSDTPSAQKVKSMLLNAILPLQPQSLRVPKNKSTTLCEKEANEERDGGDFETMTIMQRPTPPARHFINAIIDAQELDLQEQEPIEGLIGNTPSQIDATWPRFIYEELDQHDKTNQKTGYHDEEYIYQHEFIKVRPFRRSLNNDKELSEEIQSFDYLLANLNPRHNFAQLQSFLVQFFRHDICLTFSQKHPQIFQKLIKPLQPEFDPSTGLLDVDFIPPDFSPRELGEVRWLLSNLHTQYQLVQKYKTKRENFEFDLAKSLNSPKSFPLEVEFKHVMVGGGFMDDKLKDHYVNDIWKGYVVGAHLDEKVEKM